MPFSTWRASGGGPPRPGHLVDAGVGVLNVAGGARGVVVVGPVVVDVPVAIALVVLDREWRVVGVARRLECEVHALTSARLTIKPTIRRLILRMTSSEGARHSSVIHHRPLHHSFEWPRRRFR